MSNFEHLPRDVDKMKNPIQPVYLDEHGTLRFKPNGIIRYLFENRIIDLNALALIKFNQTDREQFAQMLGYSLSGYGDLSYVSNETYNAAHAMAEGATGSDLELRNQALQAELDSIKETCRKVEDMMSQITSRF